MQIIVYSVTGPFLHLDVVFYILVYLNCWPSSKYDRNIKLGVC